MIFLKTLTQAIAFLNDLLIISAYYFIFLFIAVKLSFITNDILLIILFVLPLLFYIIHPILNNGVTIGKKIMGIKLVDFNGNTINKIQYIKRII